ncbi:MAG: flagellar motor switch protein FliM [Desulfobacterales bacterium]|jgi:flagellar motor switch protein FliM|nr:flagellar motor switch protein FliM [Desulfobacterales bacterium]
MPDQILTQEEIDALLSAMDRGDVDLEQTPAAAEAAPYNLTAQNIMLRDQFSALGEVYDKFAALLNGSLSSLLQRSIEVSFVSTEMVKYQECISAFPSPTSFIVFTMEPLIGSALLAIEPGLVFSLIDCMFGGRGKPLGRMREFTQLEQRLITRLAGEILAQLQKAWQIVQPVKISIRKTETKPEYVHLVSPHDMMVVVVFALKGKEFSGNLQFCISYLMLDPVKEKLSSKYLREKDIEHTWSRQLQGLLMDTPVTLIAELGRTRRTIGEILNLKVDDVIPLPTGPDDQILVAVDHVPKFLAYPGVIKGSRAIEIAAPLNRNGGSV